MADVFQDLLVMIESADGTRRGSLTSDNFRASMGCSRVLLPHRLPTRSSSIGAATRTRSSRSSGRLRSARSAPRS